MRNALALAAILCSALALSAGATGSSTQLAAAAATPPTFLLAGGGWGHGVGMGQDGGTSGRPRKDAPSTRSSRPTTPASSSGRSRRACRRRSACSSETPQRRSRSARHSPSACGMRARRTYTLPAGSVADHARSRAAGRGARRCDGARRPPHLPAGEGRDPHVRGARVPREPPSRRRPDEAPGGERRASRDVSPGRRPRRDARRLAARSAQGAGRRSQDVRDREPREGPVLRSVRGLALADVLRRQR